MRTSKSEMTYNRDMYDMEEVVDTSTDQKKEEDSKPKKRPYTKRKRLDNEIIKNVQESSKRVRIDKKWIDSENVDIDDIVNQILLSVPSENKSSHTVFSLSEWETAEHIVQMLFKECPTITKSKMDFAMHMSYLYDKIMYN